MPIYEYWCNKCGHDFEALVRTTDQKIVCPECGGRKVTKKLSLFAVSGVQSGKGSACGSCTATSCSSCSVR